MSSDKNQKNAASFRRARRYAIVGTMHSKHCQCIVEHVWRFIMDSRHGHSLSNMRVTVIDAVASHRQSSCIRVYFRPSLLVFSSWKSCLLLVVPPGITDLVLRQFAVELFCRPSRQPTYF